MHMLALKNPPASPPAASSRRSLPPPSGSLPPPSGSRDAMNSRYRASNRLARLHAPRNFSGGHTSPAAPLIFAAKLRTIAAHTVLSFIRGEPVRPARGDVRETRLEQRLRRVNSPGEDEVARVRVRAGGEEPAVSARFARHQYGNAPRDGLSHRGPARLADVVGVHVRLRAVVVGQRHRLHFLLPERLFEHERENLPPARLPRAEHPRRETAENERLRHFRDGVLGRLRFHHRAPRDVAVRENRVRLAHRRASHPRVEIVAIAAGGSLHRGRVRGRVRALIPLPRAFDVVDPHELPVHAALGEEQTYPGAIRAIRHERRPRRAVIEPAAFAVRRARAPAREPRASGRWRRRRRGVAFHRVFTLFDVVDVDVDVDDVRPVHASGAVALARGVEPFPRDLRRAGPLVDRDDVLEFPAEHHAAFAVGRRRAHVAFEDVVECSQRRVKKHPASVAVAVLPERAPQRPTS
eukprot:31169-Pelagococcus_subviridis.AAC.4